MTMKLAIMLLACATSTTAIFGAYDPTKRLRSLYQESETLIADGKHSLARSMLNAVVTSPYLSAKQRAHAFYTRGYSFQSEGFYLSAAHDYSRALEFDSNNSSALAALAGMHAHCESVICDPVQAYRYALKAARGGNKQGKLLVGTALLYGKGTPQNISKAQYWLKEAAVNDNHADAFSHYALTFRSPYAEEPEPQTALLWYEKAERARDENATLAIAYMYRDGEFGSKSIEKAVERFTQLATAGNVDAQAALAHINLTDETKFLDLNAALYWYSEAAKQNDESAFIGLGYMYENGVGISPDPIKAAEWYKRGAQLGYVSSQLKLGLLQYRSAMTEEQAQQALAWLKSAAAQENPGAMNAIAWIYSTSKYSSLRKGLEGIRFATHANELLGTHTTLDTLAAAYAESGNYDKAIALQRSILTDPTLNPDSHADYTNRLETYLEKKPWRE